MGLRTHRSSSMGMMTVGTSAGRPAAASPYACYSLTTRPCMRLRKNQHCIASRLSASLRRRGKVYRRSGWQAYQQGDAEILVYQTLTTLRNLQKANKKFVQ